MLRRISAASSRQPALLLLALLSVLAIAQPSAAVAPSPGEVAVALLQDDATWPQEIVTDEGELVVYQPQPEKLEGNVLHGRAAFQLEMNDSEPAFGAFFFEATLARGSDDDSFRVRTAEVTRVSWPDSTDAGEERFSEFVKQRVQNAGIEISRVRLSSSLADAQQELASLDLIKNDAPDVVFRDELAVLLLFDGEPLFEEIDNSDYERALNTPLAVVRRKGGPTYLSSGQFWYQAGNVMGPYEPIAAPPADLAQMMEGAPEAEGGPSSPPGIVVATQPTELIATDGEPEWSALSTGDLLYVVNTETPWLRLISANEMFILLSGRWYRSSSQDGPWEFVRGDSLPDAFAEIPADSDLGGVRTSVAGTEEAQDALLDSQLPEVTAIKRSEASLQVEYAGDPEFEGIEGTSVAYAVNTSAQVLLIDGRYYAADNGVWFTSASATGPWSVADSIPEDQIQEIPASSPVYNTTHVHVYDSTPEVVYVGYTPGYMWSFPYYGVPICGTGWYYPPYYRPGYYYPRTPTWGFHVGYNPWTGWNFGLSWSNGFFSFGIGFSTGWGARPCCGGWYGGGYRRPVVINTGDINIGNNVNVGNRTNVANRVGNDRMNTMRSEGNLYNRPETRARNADRSTLSRDMQRARPSTARANHVFADRNGNVARRTGDQWQTRQNGQWQNSAANRASTSTRSQLDRGGLNRSLQSRSSGARRETSMRGRSGGGRRRR
ncbi:MAG: carbohydrate-binding family V/XII [Acidobacteria bacterium]|nr:carbohydrate-binding family V/XII [Acidobacteriota bacterium]